MALSRTRIAQFCALLLAAALALLAIPGSPLQPDRADAAGCAEIRDRTVRVAASERTSTKWVKRDRSGNITYTDPKTIRNVDLGRVVVKLELCKSDGKWSIRKVDVDHVHHDVALKVQSGKVTEITPVDGNFGYLVLHRRTGDNVNVSAYRCTPTPKTFTQEALETIQGIRNIPTPGKYVTEVASWAVEMALPPSDPPKYRCGVIGSVVKIDLLINGGEPRLDWSNVQGIRVVRDSWEQPCGGDYYTYCAEIWDETVIIKAP